MWRSPSRVSTDRWTPRTSTVPPRPDAGSQPRPTANTTISSSPTQKVGKLNPRMDPVINRAVEPGGRPGAGQHAQRDTHGDRDQHGGRRKLQRRRQAFHDDAARALPEHEGRAEVAVQQPPDEQEVLPPNRLVQAHVGPEPRHVLRRGLRVEEDAGRVAHGAQGRERQERQGDHDDQPLTQSPRQDAVSRWIPRQDAAAQHVQLRQGGEQPWIRLDRVDADRPGGHDLDLAHRAHLAGGQVVAVRYAAGA